MNYLYNIDKGTCAILRVKGNMALQFAVNFIGASFKAIALGAMLFSAHAYSQAHSDNKKEALIKRQPNDIVDTYLNQILCSNKSLKLRNENRALALSAQVSDEEINKAFSSEIFYSLKPGEESKGSAYIKKAYSDANTVLDNLRVLAVFFGHDIHNFFVDENKSRASRNLPALSKAEFIEKFENGEITLKADDVNLNEFIEERLAQIEKTTESMQYGCDGKENFLHRQGSELSKSISESAFLIPTTAAAIRVAANITPPSEKPERKPASTGPTEHKPLEQAQQVVDRTSSGRFAHYAKFIRQGVPAAALNETMRKFFDFKRQGAVTNDKHVVVVDYTKHSKEPRFWVLNLQTGNVSGMKMGHGDGKGLLSGKQKIPMHATAFVSSVESSDASSWGAMVLAGPKQKGVNSKFNHASYVKGLEPHNANVYDRDIIVHEGINNSGQVYVTDTPGVAAGRSNGCFTLSPANAKWVHENLPAGTFLNAYKGDIPDIKANQRSEARQAVARAQ